MNNNVRELVQVAVGAAALIGVIAGAAIFFAALGDLIH